MVEGFAGGAVSGGARVEVTSGGRRQRRHTFGRPVTIGLGGATSIDSLFVYWPNGTVKMMTGPELDRYLDIACPTTVQLAAESSSEGVVLAWTTPGNAGYGGYRIQRIMETGDVFKDITSTVRADQSGKYYYIDRSAFGNTYRYRLKALTADGGSVLFPPVNTIPGVSIPDEFELGHNYPNPFNSGTTITFSLPIKSRVSLEVYNLLGQRVRRLAEHEMEPGSYKIFWDGKDERGKAVSSGTYFYRIRTTGLSDQERRFTASKKMMIIK
jgi:hypothetical protein